MYELIKELLASVWNTIKKIIVKVLNFFKNIVSWFKEPSRLRKIKEDKNKMAIVIKEKMKNGDYEVINVLFDKNESEILDAEVISAGDIDQETHNKFKDKDMVILN